MIYWFRPQWQLPRNALPEAISVLVVANNKGAKGLEKALERTVIRCRGSKAIKPHALGLLSSIESGLGVEVCKVWNRVECWKKQLESLTVVIIPPGAAAGRNDEIVSI